MNKKIVKQRLLEAIKKEGTQSMFAKKYRITQPYVSDMLSGKRGIPENILKDLGLKIDYVEID